MLSPRRIIWAMCLVLATGFAPPAVAQNLFSRPGVLLLKNGEMLPGIITAEGDRYRISLEHGEIRVRTDQVEAKFNNSHEVYLHLRGKIAQSSAAAHLELARWCVRNGLTSEAVDELARAKAIDPAHRGVQALAEQMLYRHVADTTAQREAEPAKPLTHQEELRQLVEGLPDGGMETFTSTIQPLLLNSCSTSACHGLRSANSYKLYRAGVGSKQTAHMTQLNLKATLRFVDRKNPAASRLLTMAAEPHSKARANLLGGVNSASYRHLESWVRMLAVEPLAAAAGDQPSSVGVADVILSQSLESPARRPFDAVVPGQMDLGPEVTAGNAPRTIHSPHNMPAAAAQRHATGVPAGSDEQNPWKFQRAPSVNWQLPRAVLPTPAASERHSPPMPAPAAGSESGWDPFDPQIFNQQFHAETDESAVPVDE